MRIMPVFLLMAVLAPAFSKAQQPVLVIHDYEQRSVPQKTSQYNMSQFEGRWQETGRSYSKSKENVTIVDTLYIHFYKDDKADTKQGNSLVITGSTELFRDDYITTSANDFKIVSVTHNQIVLDDLSGFQRTLSRKKIFDYEINKNAAGPPPKISKATIDLSPSIISKNWYAYKRGAEPGFINSSTALIRKLNIAANSGENYTGEVGFAISGKAFVQPCSISFTGHKVTIVTEGTSWSLEVYKADAQEMILGERDGVVYYFKN